MPKKSPKRASGQPIDNTTMVIKVAGNEYCVTNKPKRHSKSYSLGSISDFNIEVEKTKIDRGFYNCDSKRDENSNNEHTKCKEDQNRCDSNNLQVENCEGTIKSDGILTTNSNTKINTTKEFQHEKIKHNATKPNPNASNINRSSKTVPKGDMETNKSHTGKNYSLAKSRSEGNPFHNKKRGKIIQVQRPQSHRGIKFCWHRILQLFDHLLFYDCFLHLELI